MVTFREFCNRVFGGEQGEYENVIDQIWQSNIDEDGLILLALPGSPAKVSIDLDNHCIRIECRIAMVPDCAENRTLLERLSPFNMLRDNAGWFITSLDNNDAALETAPVSLYHNAICIGFDPDDPAAIMEEANRVLQIILPRWESAARELCLETPATRIVV